MSRTPNKALLERIEAAMGERRLQLMEVCGTHTVAIAKSGLRSILPPEVRLVSGPGCPVCVTPTTLIDRAIALARLPEVIVASFGDMLRVPGSAESLESAKAQGADVSMVYSPRDCLKIARDNSDQKVVFFAVGFETTQPGIAATIREAEESGIDNFMVLAAMKTIPCALRFLVEDDSVNIDGFILPGHVSAILGMGPYDFLAEDFGLSGVVAGFEGPAILSAIARLAELICNGNAAIENSYPGVVRAEGNPAAKEMVASVFEPGDSEWRGMGVIPGSGIKLRSEYKHRDAFGIEVSLPEPKQDRGNCRCGEVLRGLIEPNECGMFGKACTPAAPIGPCMVSAEGACQAHYRFGSS